MAGLTHTESILYRIARWLVIIAGVLCVWLFGGAEPWAYIFCLMLVILGGCFWLFALAVYPGFNLRVPLITALLLLMVIVAMLQYVPLPGGVVKAAAPFSAKVSELTCDMQPGAFSEPGIQEQLDRSRLWGVSVSPVSTSHSMCMYLSYLLAFLVTANCVRKWSHLKRLTIILVISGFVLAVTGIIHELSGSQRILWFHIPRYGGNIFGTFTNRNHYAFCANIFLGITIGRFLSSIHIGPEVGLSDWRERLAWMSTKRASRIFLLGFAAIFMGGSVFFSLSRGGMASLAASLGIVGILYSRNTGAGGSRKVLVSMMALTVGVVVWLGWQPVVERLGTLAEAAVDPVGDTRFKAAADTLRIFAASPVLGTGFGTFQYVFPAFSSADLQFGRWHHAHNDWAQLLAEGGIVTGVLVLSIAALFVWYVVKSMRTALGHKPCYFLVGAMVAFVASLLHSFVDFGLHKPANGLLFAILCGLMVSASRLCVHVHDQEQSSTKSGDQESTLHDSGPRLVLLRMAFCLALCVCAASLFKGTACLKAELSFKKFEYAARQYDLSVESEEIDLAVVKALKCASECSKLQLHNPDALRIVTEKTFGMAVNRAVKDQLRYSAARTALKSAVATVSLTPSDYLAWLWLSKSLGLMGKWDDADLALEYAKKLKPKGPEPALYLN